MEKGQQDETEYSLATKYALKCRAMSAVVEKCEAKPLGSQTTLSSLTSWISKENGGSLVPGSVHLVSYIEGTCAFLPTPNN